MRLCERPCPFCPVQGAGLRFDHQGYQLAEQVLHYSIPNVQDFGGPILEDAASIKSSKILLEEETLLVSKLNPRKTTICIAVPDADFPTVAPSEVVPIQSDQFNRSYARYLWSSEKVTDKLSAIVQSVMRSHQRVNPADITKLHWRWPDLETQQRIARYLDDKTARIDALIDKKRALLDRLAEKRQALITRTVTRGLNPTAPLKVGGIDWLGQIPAHWDVRPLKWRVSIQSGQVDPVADEYKDLPLIAPDHIEQRIGRIVEVRTADEQAAISGRYLCPPARSYTRKLALRCGRSQFSERSAFAAPICMPFYPARKLSAITLSSFY